MSAPDAADRTTLPPIEVRNLNHAKHFCIYRNGDSHFPGYQFRWNKKQCRTFDAFLGAVTDGVKPRNGAVRRLYTPTGGTRIMDFSHLEEGGVYVAAPQERFKKIKYTEIEKTPRSRPRKNYLDIPPKNEKYTGVPGKVKSTNTQSILVHVWRNADSIHGPCHISLKPSELENMDRVVDAVESKLRNKICRIYTRSGYHINDPKMMHNNEFYVGCRLHERFQSCRYQESELINFKTSPVAKASPLPPLPFNSSRGSKSSKEWSPDHSSSCPPSENSYKGRYKRNQRHSQEQDAVVPRRPVAYKRSSERKQKEVDYDRADGVYRRQGQRGHSDGAREVQDSKQTRVDLPLDQVEAEEVKEEELNNYESRDDKTAPVPSDVELTKLPSEETKEEEEDEEERITGRKTNRDNNTNNNRTPPKTKSKGQK